MTTIATNNYPKAPTNITHKTPPSLGRPQPNNQSSIIPNQSNPQTAHVAQFNRKLQPFYAKQTQFPKPEMDLTPYYKTAYGNLRVCSPRKNKPNFNPPIEDRSLSRLVGAALLFRAFSFSCFEFVSDLDIRISCFNPTIMQNKPNFQKPEMNLTPYCKRAYGGFRVCSPRKNKPKRTQFRTHCFLRITVQAFSLRTNSASPFPIGAHKAVLVSSKLLKIPQKSHVCLSFSYYFSHFLIFSQVFARFQHFPPPISAFVRVVN